MNYTLILIFHSQSMIPALSSSFHHSAAQYCHLPSNQFIQLLHFHEYTDPSANMHLLQHQQRWPPEPTHCFQCLFFAHSSTDSSSLLWNHCFGPVCLLVWLITSFWLLLGNMHIMVHCFLFLRLISLGFDGIELNNCLARLPMNLWTCCITGSTGSSFAISFVDLRCAQETIAFRSLICSRNEIWTVMINVPLMRIEEILFYGKSYVSWEFHAAYLYKICRLPRPARQ